MSVRLVSSVVLDPNTVSGEATLHIALVHGDIDMVAYLLSKHEIDVNGVRCQGAFFRPGGSLYLGEHPLAFAACLDQYAPFAQATAFLHGPLKNLARTIRRSCECCSRPALI